MFVVLIIFVSDQYGGGNKAAICFNTSNIGIGTESAKGTANTSAVNFISLGLFFFQNQRLIWSIGVEQVVLWVPLDNDGCFILGQLLWLFQAAKQRRMYSIILESQRKTAV